MSVFFRIPCVATSFLLDFYLIYLVSQIHGFYSVDLKSMQAENSKNIIPPTSRSSNYIALRFCNPPLQTVRVDMPAFYLF